MAPAQRREQLLDAALKVVLRATGRSAYTTFVRILADRLLGRK